MSDESELASAVKEQVGALKQANLVSAASVAQRQNEADQQQKRDAAALHYNSRVQALNFATKLGIPAERTAETVMQDAEKFVLWLNVGPAE